MNYASSGAVTSYQAIILMARNIEDEEREGVLGTCLNLLK